MAPRAKLYDPAAYHSAVMAEDVRALLDHLAIERADVMGYSMGARITAFLALRASRTACAGRARRAGHPAGRRRRAAGKHRRRAGGAVARRCARSQVARAFRAFAEQTKSDRKALAACIRGSRQTLTRQDAAKLTHAGAGRGRHQGRVAGSAQALAALLPRARALDIPGRDHMLAVGDRVYKQGVLDFLAETALIESSGNPLERLYFAAIYDLAGQTVLERRHQGSR